MSYTAVKAEKFNGIPAVGKLRFLSFADVHCRRNSTKSSSESVQFNGTTSRWAFVWLFGPEIIP